MDTLNSTKIGPETSECIWSTPTQLDCVSGHMWSAHRSHKLFRLIEWRALSELDAHGNTLREGKTEKLYLPNHQWQRKYQRSLRWEWSCFPPLCRTHSRLCLEWSRYWSWSEDTTVIQLANMLIIKPCSRTIMYMMIIIYIWDTTWEFFFHFSYRQCLLVVCYFGSNRIRFVAEVS